MKIHLRFVLFVLSRHGEKQVLVFDPEVEKTWVDVGVGDKQVKV